MQLSQVYPKLFKRLHMEGQSALIPLFESEGLGIHWFPGFLKNQKLAKTFWELAQLELLLWQSQHQEFGEIKKDPQQIILNPQAHTLLLEEFCEPFQLQKGLYFVHRHAGNVRITRIKKSWARIVDLLSEGERKFTHESLKDFLNLDGMNPQDIEEAVNELLQLEILSL